jgi:8-oxo-dGTP pyrophosphatase MutT (NUDIX family)
MTFTGAGLILISPDYDVLVVQDASSRKWGFPKGHREKHDDNDLATALRELSEETGIQPHMLTVHDTPFRLTKGSSSYIFRYATMDHNPEVATVQNRREIANILWVPLFDLLAMQNTDTNKYLRTWIEDMRASRTKKSIQVFNSLLLQRFHYASSSVLNT